MAMSDASADGLTIGVLTVWPLTTHDAGCAIFEDLAEISCVLLTPSRALPCSEPSW